MRLYILSNHPKKRGATCPAPEVLDNLETAAKRFQEYCGANIGIDPEGPSMYTHWKTGTVTRCDVADLP